MSGVVVWRRDVGPDPACTRILPDGCLDVIWDGQRLFVAGPDTRAREHASPAGARYAALRLSAGWGPAVVGVGADELRDRTVRLDQVWSPGAVRALVDRVAGGSVAALETWVRERAIAVPVDPLGPAVLALASAGVSVHDMARQLGVSPRQLHRRCCTLFGYGPRHLVRVQRLGRVLEQSLVGTPLAQVAHACGYADQAHLSREVRDLTGTTPTRLLRESIPG